MTDQHLPADERVAFETWLLEMHGLTANWTEARDCYDNFTAHLAHMAWIAGSESQAARIVDLEREADRLRGEIGTHIGEKAELSQALTERSVPANDGLQLEAPIELIREQGQPTGIRDRSGFRCFFPRATKFEGQDERYARDLAQRDRIANFIFRALKGEISAPPIATEEEARRAIEPTIEAGELPVVSISTPNVAHASVWKTFQQEIPQQGKPVWWSQNGDEPTMHNGFDFCDQNKGEWCYVTPPSRHSPPPPCVHPWEHIGISADGNYFCTECLANLVKEPPFAPEPPTGWLPVETAPKDATWILLRGRTSGGRPVIPVVASWSYRSTAERSYWRSSDSGRDVSHMAVDWKPVDWQSPVETEGSKP